MLELPPPSAALRGLACDSEQQMQALKSLSAINLVQLM